MVIRHKVDGGLGGKVYGVEGWDLREMGIVGDLRVGSMVRSPRTITALYPQHPRSH